MGNKSMKAASDEDGNPLGQRRKNSTDEEKKEKNTASSDEDDKPLGQRRKNSTDEEKKKQDSDSEEKAPEDNTKKKSRRERKGRCQTCSGCKRDDCGKCTNCKDKPKFGGRNVLKQACELRVCLEMSVREKPKREKRGPKKGPRRTEDNDDDEDIDESTVQRQQLNQDSNLRGSSRKSIKKNKNKKLEEVVLESEDDEESSEDDQYVVEKILEKRTDSELGFTLYKVKWRGFSYEECTWEPIENLTDETGTCVHLERYEEKLKLKEMIGDEEEDDEDEGGKKRKGRVPMY